MTQHKRLLELLQSYHGEWCPLPKILDLHIAQYGRVINDLRKGKVNKTKHIIDNYKEWHNGEWCSWFRLRENVNSTAPEPIHTQYQPKLSFAEQRI